MIKMPLPVNKPDLNGIVYSRQALPKAFANASNLPIELIQNDGVSIPVGIVTNAEYIEDENGDYAYVTGVLWHGGTQESVIFDDKHIVVDMNITGVGLTK